MDAGCFDACEEELPLDPPSRTIVIFRHKLKQHYVGRFKALAEDYEGRGKTRFTSSIEAVPRASRAGIVNVLDFLSGRWLDAFRSIADQIADGGGRLAQVRRVRRRRLPARAARLRAAFHGPRRAGVRGRRVLDLPRRAGLLDPGHERGLHEHRAALPVHQRARRGGPGPARLPEPARGRVRRRRRGVVARQGLPGHEPRRGRRAPLRQPVPGRRDGHPLGLRVLPAKLDVAWPYTYEKWGRPHWDFSLSPDF